jgi:hypothetical protein
MRFGDQKVHDSVHAASRGIDATTLPPKKTNNFFAELSRRNEFLRRQ